MFIKFLLSKILKSHKEKSKTRANVGKDFSIFLKMVVNERIGYLADLNHKVYDSIGDWAKSISARIETGDLIFTNGVETIIVSEKELQNAFEKYDIKTDRMNEKELAGLLSELAFKKAKCKEKHRTSLTLEEEFEWLKDTKNEVRVYQVTNL